MPRGFQSGADHPSTKWQQTNANGVLQEKKRKHDFEKKRTRKRRANKTNELENLEAEINSHRKELAEFRRQSTLQANKRAVGAARIEETLDHLKRKRAQLNAQTGDGAAAAGGTPGLTSSPSSFTQRKKHDAVQNGLHGLFSSPGMENPEAPSAVLASLVEKARRLDPEVLAVSRDAAIDKAIADAVFKLLEAQTPKGNAKGTLTLGQQMLKKTIWSILAEACVVESKEMEDTAMNEARGMASGEAHGGTRLMFTKSER